jgi:hypothetical protein
MVQTLKKNSAKRPGALNKARSAKVSKKLMHAKLTKKGNSLELPKQKFREEALEDRALSKAIARENEQKVAAKLIQGGGKIGIKDLMRQGKDINREVRKKQVKKKVGRVEEKLNNLKTKAEKEGLI